MIYHITTCNFKKKRIDATYLLEQTMEIEQ